MWHHHYGSSHWCQWTPNLYFRVFFRHYSTADRIVFVEPDRNLIFRRNWFRLIECFSVRSRKKFFEPSSRWSIGDQSLNQNLNGDAFFDRKTTQAAKVAPTHLPEWQLSERLLPAQQWEEHHLRVKHSPQKLPFINFIFRDSNSAKVS